jgi:hypothetical protein
LVTPDLVAARLGQCNGMPRQALANAPNRMIAIEVKKLERTKSGKIARASGLDYNTTPPCGMVRVYDATTRPLDIRGFYLFLCQEPHTGGRQQAITALCLCDGNLLNADFQYYLSIVGQRSKEIGLGTYGNGVNRQRPMLIFANPLGATELDGTATLVHPRDDLANEMPGLVRVGTITRKAPSALGTTMHCYRTIRDTREGTKPFELTDPFPTPASREEQTQPRGRFRINVKLCD